MKKFLKKIIFFLKAKIDQIGYQELIYEVEESVNNQLDDLVKYNSYRDQRKRERVASKDKSSGKVREESEHSHPDGTRFKHDPFPTIDITQRSFPPETTFNISPSHILFYEQPPYFDAVCDNPIVALFLSIPRDKPSGLNSWNTRYGNSALCIINGNGDGIPYGKMARILFLYICREVILTGNNNIVLGSSLSVLLADIHRSDGGYGYKTLGEQLGRILDCHVEMFGLIPDNKEEIKRVYSEAIGSLYIENGRHVISVNEDFANDIKENPILFDLNHIKKIANSAYSMDIYILVINNRLNVRKGKPYFIKWDHLKALNGRNIHRDRKYREKVTLDLQDNFFKKFPFLKKKIDVSNPKLGIKISYTSELFTDEVNKLIKLSKKKNSRTLWEDIVGIKIN